MTNHLAPLAQWHEALTKALRDGAIEAVPGILVRMARDGWGQEAEEARRMLTAPPRQALGALLGHDEEAARQLEILQQAYRAGGLHVLRAVAHDFDRIAAPGALGLVLIEAVLALAEHGPGARHAAQQAAFDRAEQANEDEEARR